MRFFEDSGIGWVSEILLRVTRRSACSGVASLRYKAWYVAIITPSRHMETLMLAIVSNVRRRLRQQFFRTRGRNRNMQVFLVYEFPRPRVSGFYGGGRPGRDTAVWKTVPGWKSRGPGEPGISGFGRLTHPFQ